jgi:hypothetical protein
MSARSCRVIGVLAVIMAASTTLGQTTAFTYQGRLTNAGSAANGLHDLRFRLFDALTGGAQVGAVICIDNVVMTDGLFTVSLDFGAVFSDQQRFLEIEVRADTGLNCANTAGFVVLAPRQALTGTPNSLFSMNADKLDGLDSTAFLQSVPNPLSLSGTNATSILSGQNASVTDSSAGVMGRSTAASGSTFGVFGQSDSPSGNGVQGLHSATTGLGAGIVGTTSSNSNGTLAAGATGVLGVANSSSFGINTAGVRGINNGIGVAFGVIGVGGSGGVYGSSASGNGVVGESSSSVISAAGGSFSSSSPTGRGVFATAPLYGVFATTVTANGTGVYGESNASTGTGYGVHGRCSSPDGAGVFGENTSGTGYAGYFEGARNYFSGDVGVGTTTPAAKLEVRGDIRLGSSGQYFAPGGEENLRIVRGSCNAFGCGFGITVTAGTGFTASLLDDGLCLVTFTTPFNGLPTVTASGKPSGCDTVANIVSVTNSSAEIRLRVSDDPCFSNPCGTGFHFIAVGPR